MARFGLLLAVALGGAVGSVARWAAVTSVDDQRSMVIFGLNVAGSLLLGALVGQQEALGDQRMALLGTGFAGGLTTFSTFAVSVAQGLEDGRLLDAAANGFGTPVTAVVAAGIGYRFSRIGGAMVMARSAARRRRGARRQGGRFPIRRRKRGRG